MRLLSWLGLSSSGLSSVDEWALRNADRCSPDDLIAAACITSFAKDFPDWSASSEYFGPNVSRWSSDVSPRAPRLQNIRKNIVIEFVRTEATGALTRSQKKIVKSVEKYADLDYTWYYNTIYACKLNNVMLDESVTQRLMTAWQAAASAHKALVEAEARAKAAMELNEKKWDMAEDLFGFTRTEQGALVASTGQDNAEHDVEAWIAEDKCLTASSAGSLSQRPALN